MSTLEENGWAAFAKNVSPFKNGIFSIKFLVFCILQIHHLVLNIQQINDIVFTDVFSMFKIYVMLHPVNGT